MMKDAMYIPTLEDMIAARERIAPHVHRTPVLTSSFLNGLTGAELYFKCENLQKAGAFKADDYGVYSFMKNGGCSLAPLGTFDSKVPDDVKARIAEKEKAIKDGSFTVEINDAEPKSS